MRKPKSIKLTQEERDRLCSFKRSTKISQAIAYRAKIVLLADKGMQNKKISKEVKISRQRVGYWRNRYIKLGIDGLFDAPRSGRPVIYNNETISKVIAKTLIPPKDSTHWSTRKMAKEMGMSHFAVHSIWRKHNLKPHLTKSFKYSNDPQLIEKTIDIVGLYLNPPENALFISVDEKSQIQALDRTQPLLPLRPGQVERHTHDYVRHGTTTLFAALDVANGIVTGECYNRHRHQEFLRFLNLIDKKMPHGVEIHLILDNYSTHKHPKVKEWFRKRPRYILHFTPTSASWLNQIEIWFSILSNNQIRRGVFKSVKELINKIKTFIENYNKNAKPFIWTKDAKQILSKIIHK